MRNRSSSLRLPWKGVADSVRRMVLQDPMLLEYRRVRSLVGETTQDEWRYYTEPLELEEAFFEQVK